MNQFVVEEGEWILYNEQDFYGACILLSKRDGVLKKYAIAGEFDEKRIFGARSCILVSGSFDLYSKAEFAGSTYRIAQRGERERFYKKQVSVFIPSKKQGKRLLLIRN